MTETALSPAYVETPVFFDAEGHSLFGVLTMPSDGGARTGLIILPGGGALLTVNRNRVSVRVCREFAALGFAAFRIDYHGAGDSTGSIEEFRLDRPFVGDVVAAVNYLMSIGVERVVLAGSCFGARTALSAAARLDNVDSVILISTALRDYPFGEVRSLATARRVGVGHYLREMVKPSRIKGLLDPRVRGAYRVYAVGKLRVMAAKIPLIRRAVTKPTAIEEVSSSFEAPLRALVERGVTVRFVYGAGDGFYTDDYRIAAAGSLHDILDESRGLVELVVLPGRLHGLATVAAQDAVVEDLVGWAAAHRPAGESRTTDGAA